MRPWASKIKIINSFIPSSSANSEFIFPIITDKNHDVKLYLELYLGNSLKSKELKIIEIEKKLPKFISFAPLKKESIKNYKIPESYIKIDVKERTSRLKLWLDNSFLTSDATYEGISETKMEVYFYDVRNKKVLMIEYDYDAFNMIIRFDLIETVSKIKVLIYF